MLVAIETKLKAEKVKTQLSVANCRCVCKKVGRVLHASDETWVSNKICPLAQVVYVRAVLDVFLVLKAQNKDLKGVIQKKDFLFLTHFSSDKSVG